MGKKKKKIEKNKIEINRKGKNNLSYYLNIYK